MWHIAYDRVKTGKRAIEALDSALVGKRDRIYVNVLVLSLKHV